MKFNKTRALVTALLLALIVLPVVAMAAPAETKDTTATITFLDSGSLRFSVAPTTAVSFGSGLTVPTGAMTLPALNALAFTVVDDRLSPSPWSVKVNITQFVGSADTSNAFGGYMYMQNLEVNGLGAKDKTSDLDASHAGLKRKADSINCSTDPAQTPFIEYNGSPENYRGTFAFSMAANDASKFYFKLPATQINLVKQANYSATITWQLSTGL